MKKYRVNESEVFNLRSMYEHLMALREEAEESGAWEQEEALKERIEEIEGLLDKAYYIGALVDWPTLERIREIRDERNLIRYNRGLDANGGKEDEYSEYAFM